MQEFSLEMWIVLIAASSVVSLFLGEMLGAWRMKRLMNHAQLETPAGAASLFQSMAPARTPIDAQLDPHAQPAKTREFSGSAVACVDDVSNLTGVSAADRMQPAADISGKPQPQRTFHYAPINERANAYSAAQDAARRSEGCILDAYEEAAKPEPGAAHVLSHYEETIRLLDGCAEVHRHSGDAGHLSGALGEDFSRISVVAPVSRTIDAESLQSLRSERADTRNHAWANERSTW